MFPNFTTANFQSLLALLATLLALVVCAWLILPKPKRRPPATQSRRVRLVPLAFLAYGGRVLRSRLAFRNRKGQA